MRVELHAKVRTRDGEEAGRVQRAVIDPETTEITDFVVNTGGLFGYDVLVARDHLEAAPRDGETILLDLTKDQLEQQPVFVSARYGLPPTAWAAPSGYPYPVEAFAWPRGPVLPRSSGVREPRTKSRGR